ncbi:MAG: serine--tRNA ligase [Xanthobacteraceae bacterium]
MHDIRFIREHPDAFDRALARRGLPPESKQLIEIEARRRNLITRLEHAQAQRNAESKKIGEAKRKKDETVANRLMTEVAKLRAEISEMEGEVVALERELQFGKRIGIGAGLATLPNMPLDEVPDGKDSNDNVEHHRFGAKRDYAFTPKQHFELGEALGQMDFETAAKLSGARFVVLKRGLARLERALGQFMLDVHTSEHGYTEVAPPLVVRDEAMFGTAQLPKFSDDQFRVETEEVQRKHAYANFEQDREQILAYVEKYGVEAARRETLQALGFVYRPTPDRRWLIPTAEVPLTNFVMDSITDEAQLPMRLTACTPCFRAEAGAAGKDTRGMIRQHQFTKVELVSITTSEQSRDEHERMLSCAEEVLRRLDLHYRVVTLSTGDMGFAAQKTYDIEVWLPGQNMYREISSCSVCGDFQARRMNARYRDKDRTVRHVHTLNGSGVAVGRALIAVMETYQDGDGSIAVPGVLQTYMGGLKKIERQ